MTRSAAVTATLLLAAGCAAKHESKGAESVRAECANPVLRVDNSTNQVARIYDGKGVLVGEVGPGSHTIPLRSRVNSTSGFRASTDGRRSAGSISIAQACES